MGCGVCGVDHALETCCLLGPYLPVSDTPTLPYARLSLPAGLVVKDLISGSKTVVATKTFLRGVQFGPFKAPTSPILPPNVTFPLKLYLKNGDIVFLKTDEEYYCNWMCLVDTATCEEEINMYCYQMNENIYFSVVKDILPGSELNVWYSPHYAKVMNFKPLLCDTFLVEQSPIPAETEVIGDHQYLNKIDEKRKKKKKWKRLQEQINCSLPESIKGKLPAEVLGAKRPESEWKCHTCNVTEPNVAAFAMHLIHHIKIKLKPRCRYCNIKRNGKHEITCKFHLFQKGITDGSDLPEEYRNKTSQKNVEDLPNNVLSDSTNNLNTDHVQLADELVVKDTSSLEKQTDLLICDKDRDFVNYQFEIMDNSKSNLNLQVSDFFNKSMWNNDGVVPMDTSNSLVPLNDSSLSLKDRQLDLNPPILDLSDEIEFQSLKNFTDTLDANRFIGKPFNMCRNVGCPDLFDNVAVSNLLGVDNMSATTEQFPIFSLDKSEFQKFDSLLEVTDEDKNRLVENLLKETDERINVFDVNGVNELKEDMNGELLVSNEKSREESKKDNVKVNGSHSCEICKKCFTNPKYLVRHLRKHTGEFSCKFCLNIFARKETLLSHTCLTQTEEEPTRKRCGICSLVLHSGVELRNHISEHYCTYSIWDCKHCRLVGDDVEDIDKHYCAESNGQERQFSCNNCNKVFSTSFEFTDHRQEINVKKIKVATEMNRVCEFCGLVMKKRALALHMQQHFGKRFECKKCGMKFTRKDSMLQHEDKHTSKKNRKLFKKKKDLSLENNTLDHEESHFLTFTCKVCQKTFSSKASLNKHSVEHEKEQKGGTKVECSYCELKFNKESSLKSHIQIKHMDHKIIYTCCYCNTKVTHRHSLKRHLISRHGKSKEELEIQGALDSMKTLEMNQIEAEQLDEVMQEENFEASEQQNVQIVDKEVLLDLVNLPKTNPEELVPLSKERLLELLNGTPDVAALTATENIVGLSKEGLLDIVNNSSAVPVTDPEGLIMLSKERLLDLINGTSDVATLTTSQDLVGLNKQELLDLVNGTAGIPGATAEELVRLNVENFTVNVLWTNVENEPNIETEDMNPKTNSIVPMVQLSDSEEFVGMNLDITCIDNGSNGKDKQNRKNEDMDTKTNTMVQLTDSEEFVGMNIDIPCINNGINVGSKPNTNIDNMNTKTDTMVPMVQLTDSEEFVGMNVDITCINNGINTYILEDGRIVNEDVQLGTDIFLYVVEPTMEDQELLFV